MHRLAFFACLFLSSTLCLGGSFVQGSTTAEDPAVWLALDPPISMGELSDFRVSSVYVSMPLGDRSPKVTITVTLRWRSPMGNRPQVRQVDIPAGEVEAFFRMVKEFAEQEFRRRSPAHWRQTPFE